MNLILRHIYRLVMFTDEDENAVCSVSCLKHFAQHSNSNMH